MSKTDEELWEEMWVRKDEGREMFAQAELIEDTVFRRWNGHDARPEFTPYTRKAGSLVLITVISRFGDVGIRGTSIDKEAHGYDTRVAPERLRNLRFLSDGGPRQPTYEELQKARKDKGI